MLNNSLYKVNGKVIRNVNDLLSATVPEGGTMLNGGYDLFYEELKKYIICKNEDLMTWEDWYKKPHPSISKTEDAEFELVSHKLIIK